MSKVADVMDVGYPINAFSFSPDKKYVAIGGKDCKFSF